MTEEKKIAFIPIDNRPVCYTLAQQIANIDKNIQLLIPPREMLGDLKKTADISGIINWLKNIPNPNSIIVSLDTIAYGGLIPSRRSKDSFETIKNRMEEFKEISYKIENRERTVLINKDITDEKDIKEICWKDYLERLKEEIEIIGGI